ncbi:TetR/AcrR family transcriptional regulator [Glaciecola sp. MH2013]|uniref:TetR/AcrR family transcriptional regulator n=1 Tax=Glaciecola sp. MH2013 TaxID=2785524 RepID=UPI00189DFB12|nr:TetR/AcrR family transcriptional regulator [Glaciecola sp. MH2013]MBF7073349.1 TetR/AcrR family transcriptional regulator [Glaciecola sp. MH2013]
MPKKAQYDLSDVKMFAIEIFTEHGFANASMDEIIARTQFNRRAFYIEFGSKKAFLYAVLNTYISSHLSKCQESLLNRSEPGTLAIENYFRAYHQLILSQGCLLVNSISELGRVDIEIQSIARHYYDSLQLCFISCLERAQKHKEIRADINIESVALQLTCFTQGFAISSILQDGQNDVLIAMRQLLKSVEN